MNRMNRRRPTLGQRVKRVALTGALIGGLAAGTAGLIQRHHAKIDRQVSARATELQITGVLQPREWARVEFDRDLDKNARNNLRTLPPKLKTEIVEIGRNAFEKKLGEPLSADELRRTVETIYLYGNDPGREIWKRQNSTDPRHQRVADILIMVEDLMRTASPEKKSALRKFFAPKRE